MIVRRFWLGITGTKNVLSSLPARGYRTSDNFYDNGKDEENNLLARVEEASIETSDSSKKPHKQEKLIRVAIVGVPNAGKSTLINALAEHRVSF